MKLRKLLTYNFTTLSMVYHASVYNFLPISQIAQIITIASSFAGLFSVKMSRKTFLLILFTLCLSIFQGVYALSFATIIIMFALSRVIEIQFIARIFISMTIALSILSLIHFYGGFSLLYSPVYFSNYLIGSYDRLLGLDRSPAQLGFFAGLAICLLFYVKPTFGKSIILLLLLSILVATSSRTAILGLALALILGHFSRVNFLVIITFFVGAPFILVSLYVYNFGKMEYMLIIELLSSNRIVNWVNLLTYFFELGPLEILFGIGKPPVINQPFLLESFSGKYTYKYITYAESAIIKQFVYHGFALFIVSLAYLYRACFRLSSYQNRTVILYITFGSIYYDAVFSVQYAVISLVFFCVLRSENTCIGKRTTKL